MDTLPMRKTKARPARSVLPIFVAMMVLIGMKRITMSVAMLVNVDTVTLDMLCTAEQRCPPGGGAQFADTGVHQKAIRNMCTRNVQKVKMQAPASVYFAFRPCRLKIL